MSGWDWLIMAGLLAGLAALIVALVVILDGGWEADHGRSLWRGTR